MKVLNHGLETGDNDFMFFLNNEEAEELENSSIIGAVYVESRPPPNRMEQIIGKSVTLSVLDNPEKTGAEGACSEDFNTKFFIDRQIIYNSFKKTGFSETRYDVFSGDKITIINYEKRKEIYKWQLRWLGLV